MQDTKMEKSNHTLIEYVMEVESTGKTSVGAIRNLHVAAHATALEELDIPIGATTVSFEDIVVFDILVKKMTFAKGLGLTDPATSNYIARGKIKIARELESK